MKRTMPAVQLILTAFVLLSLFACSGNTPTPLATETPKFPTNTPLPSNAPVIETPTFTLTPTNIMQPTPTKSPQENLSELPTGQYLVFNWENSSKQSFLSIYGIDEELIETFPTNDALFYTSRDGTRLMFFPPYESSLSLYSQPITTPYYINLNNFQSSTITLSGDLHFNNPNWLPDGSAIIVASDSIRSRELFLLSQDGDIKRITDCGKIYKDCANPTLAPDGKWVAYSAFDARSGSHSGDGIYVVSTSCFSNIESCSLKQQGPIGPLNSLFHAAWSPDSQFLYIVTYGNIIKTYKTGSFEYFGQIKVNFQDDKADSFDIQLFWSPDGKFLYCDSCGGFLDIVNGNIQPFHTKTHLESFVGWISIEK